VQRDGEAAAVGVDAAGGVDRVGDGDAQDLVGDQQGVDLLADAGGGAGAQDPPAEDAGLELKVGGFDLSGSPGALLRRGPLRTGRAALTASGSSRP